MATLGNAICGFGAIYVASLHGDDVGSDPVAKRMLEYKFVAAAYLIFIAMIFDALDGRLARFARHTTDFGGQLDSLADVLSFGAAPAFLALQVFKIDGPVEIPLVLSRLVWAAGALFMCCAALRLARFNVSNEHGEQHHFSFLGLPSPGAAGCVAGFVLMQQDLGLEGFVNLSFMLTCLLPVIVAGTGLLMVSQIRYPHVVNTQLRGRRSLTHVVIALLLLLLLIVWHRYSVGIGMLVYALWGVTSYLLVRLRRRNAGANSAS